MAHKFPRLFSYAINPDVSLAELLGSRDLRELAMNFVLSQSKLLLNCKNWGCFSWSSIWIRRLVLVRLLVFSGTPGTGYCSWLVCRSRVSIYFQENVEKQVHAKTEGVYLAAVG